MSRILITGARAPAALHLARLLDGAGHVVVMADSLRRTVSAVSRACAAFVHLPAANGDAAAYGAAIREAIAAHQIDLVVPTCEEVFHLAALWAQREMQVPLYAPPREVLRRVHHKYEFVGMMQELGLAVPETVLLNTPADVDRVQLRSRELVFKPVWSRFATRVLIKPRRVDIAPTPAAPWVAQDFVAGEEICVYAFAHAGRLAGWAAYRPVHRAGGGAGIGFMPDDDPAIGPFVEQFVAKTQWTGQVSFDLMRRAGGDLVALECNPRATSGVHFFRDPAAFGAAFDGTGLVSPDVTGLQAVKAALWFYGPWQHPLRVWSDLVGAQDVIAWPDDPRPSRRQIAATWEVARVAWRQRVGLAAASTHDIEWNGP